MTSNGHESSKFYRGGKWVKQTLSQSSFQYTVWALIVCGGGLLRAVLALPQNAFSYDQAVHGEKIVGILEGNFPATGSPVSAAGFELLPLQYYFFAPFSVFGRHPFFLALPNILLTTGSIALLMILVRRIFAYRGTVVSWFYSAAAGIWWALFYWDVWFATFEWNPNGIPFFVLLSLLLVDTALKEESSKTTKRICFAGLGFSIAMFASMHSTTLFAMPVAIGVFLVWYAATTRLWQDVLWAALAFVLSLIPYWKWELQNDWTNTAGILSAVSGSSGGETYSILERVNRMVFSYIEIGPMLYFDSGLVELGQVFVAAVTILAIVVYRGNKKIWNMYLLMAGVSLLVAGSYFGDTHIHYKGVFWPLPIICTLVCIDYFWHRRAAQKYKSLAGILILIALAGVSLGQHVWYDVELLLSSFGQERRIGASDYIEAYKQVPEASTICFERRQEFELVMHRYLDEQITNKDLVLATDCSSGDFAVITKTYFYRFKEPSAELRTVYGRIPGEASINYETDAFWLVQFD